MLKYTVANLKGGSGKTTTAGYLAAGLHAAGLRPVGIDADEENVGFAGWEGLPFPVEPYATADLDKTLPGVLGDRFGSAVADTPPMRDKRSVVRGLVRWATHIVVPMAPTSAEYKRMPVMAEFLREALDGRPSPVVVVLLNRVVPGAASTKAYRDQLVMDGWHVLRPTIGRLERYAQAQDDPIKDPLNTPYGFALEETFDLTPDMAGVPNPKKLETAK